MGGHSRTPGIAAIIVIANPEVDTIPWSLTKGPSLLSSVERNGSGKAHSYILLL